MVLLRNYKLFVATRVTLFYINLLAQLLYFLYLHPYRGELLLLFIISHFLLFTKEVYPPSILCKKKWVIIILLIVIGFFLGSNLLRTVFSVWFCFELCRKSIAHVFKYSSQELALKKQKDKVYKFYLWTLSFFARNK